MIPSGVLDTGLTVLYKPENAVPVVDILLVHGLQGHPYKTWAYDKRNEASALESGPSHSPDFDSSVTNRQRTKGLFSFFGNTGPDHKGKDDAGSIQHGKVSHPTTYWPVDLLPDTCPGAQIMTWGYDSRVTKYTRKVNQDGIFAHAKNLLFELQRVRELDRPLIFVGHSLGGVIVKEVLISSHSSREQSIANVASSTAAIIFMGTPHRGSADMAALGDIARRIASLVLMDNNSNVLDALGLKTSDLERCQDSFTSIWGTYDFRVKTFQEGQPLTGINLGQLKEKVVPDFSSLLGDPREHAETLQANHMGMCRFSSSNDANYRKVGGEIGSIYKSITSKGNQESKYQKTKWMKERNGCLRSLYFPAMEKRYHTIGSPMLDTCEWLLASPTYDDWLHRRNEYLLGGLLWVKGNPGSGKSTLIKHAFICAEQKKDPSRDIMPDNGRSTLIKHASTGVERRKDFNRDLMLKFFLNAQGSDLERSAMGLFRSLLYQLVLLAPQQLTQHIVSSWKAKHSQDKAVQWYLDELKSLIRSTLSDRDRAPIYIFVDALDECVEQEMRELAYFFEDVITDAHSAGATLGVCISSRRYPIVTIQNCTEMIMEDFNCSDIEKYIKRKFSQGGILLDRGWRNLEKALISKSGGIFLWVVLIVDVLLRDRDCGFNSGYLQTRLDELPNALKGLLQQLLRDLDPEEAKLSIRLFQWALFAGRPLRLKEWYHVLAFIEDRPPVSLQSWKRSKYFVENDEQLEKRIRVISRGLLEVKKFPRPQIPEEGDSDRPDAGSLDEILEDGGTVQFIHESVREFFLDEKGFSLLNPELGTSAVSQGHVTLYNFCIDYLSLSELNDLAEQRMKLTSNKSVSSGSSLGFLEAFDLDADDYRTIKEKKDVRAIRHNVTKERRKANIRSFGSAASSYTASSKYSYSSLARSDDSGSSIWSRDITLTQQDLVKLIDGQGIIDKQDTLQKYLDTLMEYFQPATINTLPGLIEQMPSLQSNSSNTGVLNEHRSAVKDSVLDEFPELLLYATEMTFLHASLAETGGIPPDDLIARLCTKGAWNRWLSLNENVQSDTTLLYHATKLNLISWVKRLLSLGADSNEKGGEFRYPLMAAANRGHAEIMTLLLEHGADVTMTDKHFCTALHHAASSSNATLMRIYMLKAEEYDALRLGRLVEANNIANEKGLEVSIRADLLNHAEAIRLINSQDKFGQTPLHLAAWQSSEEVVTELLALGTDPLSVDSSGETPLQFARERNPPNREICKLLKQAEKYARLSRESGDDAHVLSTLAG